MRRSPRLLILACILVVALLHAATRGNAAPSKIPPQSLAVLIVCDGTSKVQRLKEEQMIALVHKSLDDQGLPREVLPILTYHTNKPDERAYCEKRLGIHVKDLVFLGLAQHQNQVVKTVILREPNVTNPTQAVATLFQRAVAVLTGVTPGATPTETPAIYTPTPTQTPTVTGGTRILSAVTCRSVNSAGEAVDKTSTFAGADSFYVSCDIKGLRNGTVLEAKWYNGNVLIRTNRLVSTKSGEYYAWFAIQPQTTWLPGSYRVVLFVDGQQQATEYFRVNDSE